MEEVAAFVFGSGGAVSVTELQRFFTQRPAVESAFFAAAAPVRQLKKIVRHFGSAHGLAWLDADAVVDAAVDHASASAGPCIVHNLTDAQRAVFPATVPQRIPQALDALTTVLGGAPGARLKLSEARRTLPTAYPEETAFMRARCGSIAAFVATYDANATRIGVSDAELWLVQAGASPGSVAASTRSTTATTATSDGTISEDDAESVDIDEGDAEAAVVPAVAPLPGLHALRVVWAVLSQLRVSRSRVSLSVDELLFQVWRLVVRNSHKADVRTTAASSVTRRPSLPRLSMTAAPAPPARPEQRAQAAPHGRRLLVPNATHGLTWTLVPTTGASA